MLPYLPTAKTSEAILGFYKEVLKANENGWNLREQFTAVDLSYMRETDCSEEQWKAKRANKQGDPTKFQNITVPVVMPQVEAAVTYQQSVFLTGFPIFGAVASPEHMDAAVQLDSINSNHQAYYRWVPELLKAIRNGFKYNFGPVEIDWDTETTYALEEGTSGDDINKQKKVTLQGNKITCLDPYNTFVDLSVTPSEVSRQGEFAGYTKLYSRIAFKQFLAKLPTRVNAKEALESTNISHPESTDSSLSAYYTPRINPDSLFEFDDSSDTNWMNWAGLSGNPSGAINYSNHYEVTTVYGRILPVDFHMSKMPGQNTPQVWKFVVVNGAVVIYAERMTNLHNLFPIAIAQPYEDGLGYQTKSLAKNVEPFQEIETALANSIIAARRRAIGDRLLYDPSRVAAASIRDDSPIARIPVRPSAFGGSMADAVHALPFRDDQSQHSIQDMQIFSQMADKTSGLNPARQGNFVKGNKTRFEFNETMNNGAGRDLTVALTLEGNFFSVIKHVIKTNVLQYQGGVSMFNPDTSSSVTIDPVMLRKAQVEFKISDGLTPSDKIMDGETLGVALQTLAQAPELAAGYNQAPLFSYLMKSRGADLSPYEKSPEQLAYEQAVGAWQQAVVAAAESVMKANPEAKPEEVQAAMPPQPLPEQYGYNPATPNVSVESDTSKTVLGRYSETVTQQAEAMAKAQQAPQGGQPGQAPQQEGVPQ